MTRNKTDGGKTQELGELRVSGVKGRKGPWVAGKGKKKCASGMTADQAAQITSRVRVIRRVFVFYDPTDPAEEDLNRPIENLIPIATKS